jgi:hypothetical protein
MGTEGVSMVSNTLEYVLSSFHRCDPNYGSPEAVDGNFLCLPVHPSRQASHRREY